MTGINIKNKEWATKQLKNFIENSGKITGTERMGQIPLDAFIKQNAEYEAKMAADAPVVEEILDRVTPGWRQARKPLTTSWNHLREMSIRACTILERDEEMRLNLGDDAPRISASKLHPWVWDGARSLWQSGHFRSAVDDALKKVNAETQNKIERRDISETKLFQEAFSENPPESGKPRLRITPPEHSNTYRSRQRGAIHLAEGIYAGIRNPINHESPQDIDEQIALEYLAALSVLARWVDEAEVQQSPPETSA